MNQPPRKNAYKIGPFRHKVEMDPLYAEKTWKILEDAIQQVYNHNASGLSFEELYRNAYNMVLQKYGDRLYAGLVQTMSAHLQGLAGGIEAAQGPLFLPELNNRWKDYLKSLQMIRDILMYMDRTYVPSHNKTPVFQLGLNLWRDRVVRAPKIRERLTGALLQNVQRERDGEVIDRGLLRSVTGMLVDLGLEVYQAEFEHPFLEASSEFYRRESQQHIATCDCADYLNVAERRLQEETERVAHYLDGRTEARVTAVVEREMIGRHMRLLVEMENSGLVPMLVNDKYEDLGAMYRLFKRVSNGLQTLRDVMGAHIRDTGKQLVTDPERLKDPVDFVQRLLDERDKYDRIISLSFVNDKTFWNALNSAFEFFVNLNQRSAEYISLFVDDHLRRGLKGASEDEVEAILDKVMTLFRYLQEKDVFEKYYKQHLAKRLLSGRTASDDAERSFLVKLKTECGYQFTSKLEGMFTDMKTSRDTMIAFQQSLAAEAAAAGGLPFPPADEAGPTEGEVEDAGHATLMEEDRGKAAAGPSAAGGPSAAAATAETAGGGGGGGSTGAPSGGSASGAGPSTSTAAHGGGGAASLLGPALSVQVLTTGSWPTQAGARCNLPAEVLPMCERFQRHYLSTHTGRKLTWQTNMGSADIKLTLDSRKYELSVSTYQMCILMLFNDADRLSYSEIEAVTNIPSVDLKRNLQSLALVKGRNVLRKEPMSKDVHEGDMFIFNDKFSSKLYKVKIGTVAASKESEPEKAETRQKVEEDRKPQIEAAIVRVMKSRRVLDHNNVVSEVTKQLQARFLPSPAVIKQRIESLIEREFLERDRNDRRMYRYLA